MSMRAHTTRVSLPRLSRGKQGRLQQEKRLEHWKTLDHVRVLLELELSINPTILASSDMVDLLQWMHQLNQISAISL